MGATHSRKRLKNDGGKAFRKSRIQLIKKRHRELILKLRYDVAEDLPVPPEEVSGGQADDNHSMVIRDIRRRRRRV